MARIHLCSALPSPDTDPSVPAYAHDDLHRMQRFAALDRFGVHTCTDDPAAADLILFVERAHAPGPYLEANRRHAFTRDHPDKVFMVNGRYYGLPFLPGVYGSVRVRDAWVPQRVRSGMYIEVCDFDHLTPDDAVADRPYLFSFVGAIRTWPDARLPLLDLVDHPRGLIVDTSEERSQLEADVPFDVETYQRRYVERTHNSKFILCPRGDNVNSMRLYEAMRMGRAPVILSDQWIAPEGPDWDRFSLRVPQAEVHTIPARLEGLEDCAEDMGRRAREAWASWFAADVIFHRTVDWCLDLQRRRVLPEGISRRFTGLSLLMPFHLRRFAETKTLPLRRSMGLS
jgi:hypothetical protein